MIVFEGESDCWYGSLWWHGSEFEEGPWQEDLLDLADCSNGLVAAAADGIHVRTGTVHGDVRLTVEICSDEPEPQVEEWEMVVDVSLFASGSPLVHLDGELDLELQPVPGWYRVRVCSRGRLEAYARAGEVGVPVEEIRLALWRADAADERVWKHDGMQSVPRERPLPALGAESRPEDLIGYYADEPFDIPA